MAEKLIYEKKGTTLEHEADGENHTVDLKNLCVMLESDREGWFAQGLQIDHFAAGKTEDEAVKYFLDTLEKTIEIHLYEYGSLKNLLHVAPNTVWQQFYLNKADKQCVISGVFEAKLAQADPKLENALKEMSLVDKITFMKSEDLAAAGTA